MTPADIGIASAIIDDQDTSYNGWTNYETWNVALWLQNDEVMYNMARGYRHHGYLSLSHMLVECFGSSTPDDVRWDDKKLDIDELNEMMEDL